LRHSITASAGSTGFANRILRPAGDVARVRRITVLRARGKGARSSRPRPPIPTRWRTCWRRTPEDYATSMNSPMSQATCGRRQRHRSVKIVPPYGDSSGRIPMSCGCSGGLCCFHRKGGILPCQLSQRVLPCCRLGRSAVNVLRVVGHLPPEGRSHRLGRQVSDNPQGRKPRAGFAR
jgi:hypothetical protein